MDRVAEMPVMMPVSATRRVLARAKVTPAMAPVPLHQRVVKAQHHRAYVMETLFIQHGAKLIFMLMLLLPHPGGLGNFLFHLRIGFLPVLLVFFHQLDHEGEA